MKNRDRNGSGDRSANSHHSDTFFQRKSIVGDETRAAPKSAVAVIVFAFVRAASRGASSARFAQVTRPNDNQDRSQNQQENEQKRNHSTENWQTGGFLHAHDTLVAEHSAGARLP